MPPTRLADPAWDDGSWGPLYLRLAWHCCGTYSEACGNGGSNGGTMRFKVEQADPENAGLSPAIARLDTVNT
jgi:cytochrome c peroxidase